MHHINDKGESKRCRAEKGNCRFAIHGDNEQDALAKLAQDHSTIPHSHTRHGRPALANFGENSYYGMLPPREIQLDALNGVTEALAKDDATQLVAACGTGKTYMHRQLLNHQMNLEGANGVGIMLTSSIRLAQDTTTDLRPIGGCDGAFGIYGEDYEVIEVHSDARPYDGKPSVRQDGVISAERIRQQMEDALAQGKKVIIVSTYDSVAKVQEAQALCANPSRFEADLLIHDEAHNVLGQQRPGSVASDENELTAYVGFHNAIPGSLQARKRLYSTATPIVQETDSEKTETKDLAEAIATAQRMRGTTSMPADQKERITFYSDNAMVGGISGFISQEVAVANGCLAKPSYEIRNSLIKGDINQFQDPIVTPSGHLMERHQAMTANPLSPATYGALNATLTALAADPTAADDNTAHNALAYVGSINQAEGFKAAFRDTALARSGGMDLATAQRYVESSDPMLKERARMRLLAEHAIVKAAHSHTDSDSVRERREAFEMFHGHAPQDSTWTPRKNVLANVDIFSEGVSIPEIDTVVISDDNKLNEKSMTQAIGRAIRVVPNNSYKKYGRVIIPSVEDESGNQVNAASVNIAAYTATRVERGLAATLIRGEGVKTDDRTTFKIYGSRGKVEERKAHAIAQDAIGDLRDLAVGNEMRNAHVQLRANDDNYKTLTADEQFQIRKSYLRERYTAMKEDGETKTYGLQMIAHLEHKSRRQVETLERNKRIMVGALASGDISSLHPEVAKQFITHGVLVPRNEISVQNQHPTATEKKALLASQASTFAGVLLTQPSTMGPAHREVQAKLSKGLQRPAKDYMKDVIAVVRGKSAATPASQEVTEQFTRLLEDENFVNSAFRVFTSKQEVMPPLMNNAAAKQSIGESLGSLRESVLERSRSAASAGTDSYAVNRDNVKTNGELSVAVYRKLFTNA